MAYSSMVGISEIQLVKHFESQPVALVFTGDLEKQRLVPYLHWLIFKKNRSLVFGLHQ